MRFKSRFYNSRAQGVSGKKITTCPITIARSPRGAGPNAAASVASA